MRILSTALGIACCALPPLLAQATVVASGPAGFVVHEEALFQGPPAQAWARLVRLQDWWDPEHSYSGQAANLSLTLKPGGCWCERLAHGGFVRHMDVILVRAPEQLRLSGGLGPLQALGVAGVLSFELEPGAEGTTRVTLDYHVSGFSPDGLASLAPAVDEVLAEQLRRYATPAPPASVRP